MESLSSAAAMELDIENFDSLRNYLAANVGPQPPITLKKLSGGVSNRAVLVAWPDGHSWVMKQALPKLRVSADWFSDPRRIQVEAKALRWLNRLGPPGGIPGLTFEDPSNNLLAMEAIPEDHQNWKSLLLSGRIVADHFEQFGRLLGTIHRRSVEAGTQISEPFADNTHFVSLRLDPYYRYTASMVPTAAEFINSLADETLRRQVSLVHGDFSPKNTLIYQGRLILLDYEVVHFGDPTFDVGFGLTHFLSKANHLLEKRMALANASKRFWTVYSSEIASLKWEQFEKRAVRHTLACLLARVEGKSPLEYLTPEEANRQRAVVLSLMGNPPSGIQELITKFVQQIKNHDKN